MPHRLPTALVVAALFVAGQARAAAPPPVMDPAPKAGDWTALSKLPDWSGVWLPVGGPKPKVDPVWTPAAAAQIATQQAAEAAGRPQQLYTNCLPEGMPSFMIMTVAAIEFLFTPGRITVLGEFDGNRLRRIYTDGRSHPDDPDPTFNGHSVGRWEGDTLVVDTVGVLPQVFLPQGQAVGLPNNGGLHIVERLRLTGPDTLKDEIEITAPKVLAAPWKLSRTFNRNRERRAEIVEASCRQGDFLPTTDADGNAVFVAIPHADGGAPTPPASAR